MDSSGECDCHTCNEARGHKLASLKLGDNGYALIHPTGVYHMVVCSICGNKRCPKATNHILECTNSNEPGQEGSVYG